MTGRVLVIAEAGVNHDGSVKKACELVEAAAIAGADIVKFQTFSSSEIAVPDAPLAHYQKMQRKSEASQREMLNALALSGNDWEVIAQNCKDLGIEFLSTGFDPESIQMLLRLGMRRLKVASGEITNLPLLRFLATLKLPIIASTGMSTLAEIRKALQALYVGHDEGGDICLLHCTSLYPAPPESVNLRAMLAMREEFAAPVGYSDHTTNWQIAIAAVALGAVVIEKHITLDSRAQGPDHAASLEPHEFKEMVGAIRSVELALGNGIKEPHIDEMEMRLIARRSIVAKRQIRKGDIISSDDITAKRPGYGISPLHWDQIVGSRATRDFYPDDFIE